MRFDRIAHVDIGAPGALGLRISNLRIKFEVHKTLTETTNSAKVEVFGLGSSTRARLKGGKDSSYLSLFAGYVEESGAILLFSGDVVHILHVRQPPESSSRIECGDGAKVLKDSYISLSYKSGVTARRVLSDIASKMGVTLVASKNLSDATYAGPFSFIGAAKEALRRVSNRLVATWAIHNGILYMTAAGDSYQSEAIVLSARTGMLSHPELLKTQKQQFDSTSERPRYKVRSLLLPSIAPGHLIKIEATGLSGMFRADDIKHSGDTFGDDWFTELEVSEA